MHLLVYAAGTNTTLFGEEAFKGGDLAIIGKNNNNIYQRRRCQDSQSSQKRQPLGVQELGAEGQE